MTGGRGRIYRFRHDFTKAVGSEARRGFCRHGINFLGCWRVRGTNFRATRNLSRYRNWFEAELCSVAVQSLGGASNLSRCRNFLAGRCAYPGAAMCHLSCFGAESSKNRDEFINYTVRVMCCSFN